MKASISVYIFHHLRIVALVSSLIGTSLAYGQAARASEHKNVKTFAPTVAVATALRDLPAVEVAAATDDGNPTFLTGPISHIDLNRAQKVGEPDLRTVLTKLAPVYGLAASDLKFSEITVDSLGFSHATYDQTKNGLPVVGARLKLHVSKDGDVYAATGNARSNPTLPAAAVISRPSAVKKVAARFGERTSASPEGRLVYVISTADQTMYLAHEIAVTGASPDGLPINALVYVDALSGDVVAIHTQILTSVNRTIRNAANTKSLNVNPPVRSEGDAPVNNTIYDTNYDNLGKAHAFYSTQFNRDSFNGQGMVIDSSNHYDVNSADAFWDQSLHRFGFGDGIPYLYTNLSLAFDIAAHEFTHGVTQYTSGLIYANEPGAINEAMSDIMAASASIYAGTGFDTSPFLIGEGIMYSGSGALRYMNDPHQNNYPDNYAQLFPVPTGQIADDNNDYGYVHYNSSIANLAFYLLASTGAHQHPRHGIDGIPNTWITGLGITKAQKIFYHANTFFLGPGSQFIDLREATRQATLDLGYGSSDATMVSLAWDVVRVPAFSNRRPMNFSARAGVGTGDNVLVVDFSLGGGGSAKNMLIRAAGPTLASQGLSGVLSNPELTLRQYVSGSWTSIAYNNDWSSSGDAALIASTGSTVGAFPFGNPSLDSAIIPSLGSGQYSATVNGVSGVTGIALFEVYDTAATNANHLVSVSARGFVGTGTNVLIGGFVINGSGNKYIMIRALGPSLYNQYSTNLVLPQISLYSGANLIRSNNDYHYDGDNYNAGFEIDSISARLGASPASSGDSGLLMPLPAGIYTVVLSGASGTTGISKLQIFEVP